MTQIAKSSNMADYMRDRRHARRQEAVMMFAGICNHCGLPDNGSHEFDHISRETKLYNLGDMWDMNWDLILAELSKCQLLCTECHQKKTLAESGMMNAKEVHGTVSSYRYCKCELCRAAKAEWTRNYRSRVGRTA